MKSFISLLTVGVILFSFLCNSAIAQKREPKPRVKGVELYSWRNKKGDWIYKLLSGTNALKKEEAVKDKKNQIKSVKELEKAFSKLAEGERVIWNHPIKGFEFPADPIQRKIKKAAANKAIQLFLPQHLRIPR